jgi:hypothetical protein
MPTEEHTIESGFDRSLFIRCSLLCTAESEDGKENLYMLLSKPGVYLQASNAL